jgi:hypothetical protein
MTTERKSDWTLVSVPGREDEHGNYETPTAWFAYNLTRRGQKDAAIEFATRREAVAFINHPENQRS